MRRNRRYSRAELLKRFNPAEERVKVDLGCGSRKKEGYLGLDRAKLPGVDIVCDIEKGLPIDDNSVDGVFSNFLFEHVANLIFLFQELYRVCRPRAIIEFRVPHYMSISAFKDPTHKTFFTEETMRYFSDDKWYGSDYGINTNFKLLEITYNYLPPLNRYRYFFLWPIRPLLRRYLWNIVHSMDIRIEVIK